MPSLPRSVSRYPLEGRSRCRTPSAGLSVPKNLSGQAARHITMRRYRELGFLKFLKTEIPQKSEIQTGSGYIYMIVFAFHGYPPYPLPPPGAPTQHVGATWRAPSQVWKAGGAAAPWPSGRGMLCETAERASDDHSMPSAETHGSLPLALIVDLFPPFSMGGPGRPRTSRHVHCAGR